MNNNNFNTFLMSLDKDLCQKGFFNLNLKLNGEIAHSYHKCIGEVVIFTIKQTNQTIVLPSLKDSINIFPTAKTAALCILWLFWFRVRDTPQSMSGT